MDSSPLKEAVVQGAALSVVSNILAQAIEARSSDEGVSNEHRNLEMNDNMRLQRTY